MKPKIDNLNFWKKNPYHRRSNVELNEIPINYNGLFLTWIPNCGKNFKLSLKLKDFIKFHCFLNSFQMANACYKCFLTDKLSNNSKINFALNFFILFLK